jgi:hypothetical protein
MKNVLTKSTKLAPRPQSLFSYVVYCPLFVN